MQPLSDNLKVIRHPCGDDAPAAQRINDRREVMITPPASNDPSDLTHRMTGRPLDTPVTLEKETPSNVAGLANAL